MRKFPAFSVVAPFALAMAACAGGGEASTEDVDIEADAGTGDSGNDSDASTDAGEDDGGNHDAGDDGGDDPGDGGREDDGGDDPGDGSPDDDGGDGDGGDDGGDDPGDGGVDDGGDDPDPPFNPCEANECFIDGSCVAAGTLQAGDSCQVCLPTENATDWTHDETSPACDGKPYWDGVSRDFPTTPYGRKTAISCHNCYVYGSSTADSLSKTLDTIHAAQAAGADLIELDIKEHNGAVQVDHNDAGSANGALFASVIGDAALKAGDQILFIESKETTRHETYVRNVLETLMAHGYATPGRPVVFRAFDNVSHNIEVARDLLAQPEFATIRPHVRLHVLFSQGDGNNIATLQNRIKGVKDKGFHGVEFHYQTANLFSALKYAESLDLGINLWTIPISVGEVYIASMRDEVDALTVDYPIAKARQVVLDDNGLVYLNAWDTPASSTNITWFAKNSSVSSTMSLTPSNRPSLVEMGPGQSLFGSTLRFFGGQAIPLYDADNDPNAGFLVSAVVRFDRTIPPDGETDVIVGKAEYAGFSLELFNPTGGGSGDAVLRFGVRVDGKYHYAKYPASKLQIGPSYLITGAYDGNGDVWLWVNNSAADTDKPGTLNEGVAQNDVPITIGADPQGDGSVRYHFNGYVQMALVQKWADH